MRKEYLEAITNVDCWLYKYVAYTNNSNEFRHLGGIVLDALRPSFYVILAATLR